MNEKIDDGGPAFPVASWINDHGNEVLGDDGMSLRDWFAGQVLSGQWTLRESEAAHITQPCAEDMARSAYRIADAMLAARKQDESPSSTEGAGVKDE